jgi:Cadherin-like
MVREPGNSLGKAKLLRLGAKPIKFLDRVGGEDKADFFKVRITQRSSVAASLKAVKADLKLQFLTQGGKPLGQSLVTRKKTVQLQTPLNAGDYYLKISPRSAKQSSPYRLRLQATALSLPPAPPPVLPPAPAPVNKPPVLAANTAAPINPGATIALTNAQLRATDADNNPLTYTVTTLPQWGNLKLNGNNAAVGTTFTQADIDSGKVTYLNKGGIRQLTTNAFYEGSEGEFDGAIEGDRVVWSGNDGNDNEIYLFDGNTVTQLTDNTIDDYRPILSGRNVVWQGYDGNDDEIFFYNGTTVSQLSNNDYSDRDYQISGNNVVWRGNDGTDNEIFFFNGTTTTQLTNNTTNDSEPQISGNNVIWRGYDGTDDEIFFYNGTTTTQLTNNTTDDYGPRISGNNVVWAGSDGSDDEIFFYNGTTTTQLTNNTTNDFDPLISGNNVVWGADSSTGREIFFYNGTTVSQLTNNAIDDSDYLISGSNVVWAGETSASNTDIFFFNGTTTTQLTNDTLRSDFPTQISGNNVVWVGRTGSRGNSNVFYYDGSQVKQVTNGNFHYNAQVSGANIAWTSVGGSDGGQDNEIFFANLARQDMFGFTVSDGAGGSVAGNFNFAIAEVPVLVDLEPVQPSPFSAEV